MTTSLACYFGELSAYPLLSREQEVDAAVRFEDSNRWLLERVLRHKNGVSILKQVTESWMPAHLLTKVNEESSDFLGDYHPYNVLQLSPTFSPEILFESIFYPKTRISSRCIIPMSASELPYKTVSRGFARANRAISTLVQGNLRLSISVAKKQKRARNSTIELCDLIQEGNLGLFKAAKEFNYHLGIKFASFASWWAKQRINRAINNYRDIRLPDHIHAHVARYLHWVNERKNQNLSATPHEYAVEHNLTKSQRKYFQDSLNVYTRVVSLNMKIDDQREVADLIQGSSGREIEELIQRRQIRQEVTSTLESHDSRTAKVLSLRYGVNKQTLKTVGEKFGLSGERIRQIEVTGLKELRRNKQLRDLVKDC